MIYKRIMKYFVSMISTADGPDTIDSEFPELPRVTTVVCAPETQIVYFV